MPNACSEPADDAALAGYRKEVREAGSNMQLDHVVLVVDDLSASVEKFESLGFCVQSGGSNGPTHNALIVFHDGSYIELIALSSSLKRRLLRVLGGLGLLAVRRGLKAGISNRFFGWFGGPAGLRDVCLRVDDLHKFVTDSASGNLEITAAQPFRRIRPDGVTVEWLLAGSVSLDQPFFIQDQTPLNLRVPGGEACNHPNQVTGIAQVMTARQLRIDAHGLDFVVDASLPRGTIAITLSSSGSEKGPLATELTSGARMVLV
jgi:catechol 2,3-dioxygenase-like lactoylglutathione lyase family enzyme